MVKDAKFVSLGQTGPEIWPFEKDLLESWRNEYQFPDLYICG